RLERAAVERLALHLATLRTRLLERIAERLGRDLFRLPGQPPHQPPVRRRAPPRRWRLHFRGVIGTALEQVLFHAEEGERHGKDRHDDDRDPTGGLFSKGLKHESALSGRSRAV